MLPRRSRHAVTATFLAAALALSLSPADATSRHRDDGTITGADGAEYARAPGVVEGRRQDLFDGYTFDIICSDGGSDLEGDIKRVGKLARLIESSGRRVVYTVVPPKALVNEDNVVRDTLPHGDCDRDGLDQQRSVYDTFADKRFLGLRSVLSADPRQLFWKTDQHWTTYGGTVFVKELAARLDPELARRQRYQRGPDQTAVGALTKLQGDDTPETVKSLVPKTDVTVKPLPGTPALGSSPYISHHDWRSTPASLTYPGRTLVLGDSFGLIALENVRPLFGRGQFLWTNNSDKTMVKAITRADTVVIESSHLFVSVSALARKSFRAAVRRALTR